MAATSSTIVSKRSGVTWRPPWRSLRLTTPTGSDIHCAIRSETPCRPPVACSGEIDPDQFRRAAADVEEDDARGVVVDQRGTPGDSEPRLGLARDDLEDEPGLLADAVDEMRRRSPPSGRPRWRSAGPAPTWRSASLAPQIFSASMARSMAGADRRPVRPIPSPSRTIREKASTTRKPWSRGAAISRRQLLVPRSRAP